MQHPDTLTFFESNDGTKSKYLLRIRCMKGFKLKLLSAFVYLIMGDLVYSNAAIFTTHRARAARRCREKVQQNPDKCHKVSLCKQQCATLPNWQWPEVHFNCKDQKVRLLFREPGEWFLPGTRHFNSRHKFSKPAQKKLWRPTETQKWSDDTVLIAIVFLHDMLF